MAASRACRRRQSSPAATPARPPRPTSVANAAPIARPTPAPKDALCSESAAGMPRAYRRFIVQPFPPPLYATPGAACLFSQPPDCRHQQREVRRYRRYLEASRLQERSACRHRHDVARRLRH